MTSLPFFKKTDDTMPKELESNLPEITADDFLPPTNPWLILTGYFLAISVLGSIIFAAFSKYNEKVNGDAVIRPTGNLRVVQSELQGNVQEILVKENQSIKKGDLLAKLDDSQLNLQKNQLENSLQQSKTQRGQIASQLRIVTGKIQTKQQLARLGVSSAEADLSRNRRELEDRRITTQNDFLAAQANLGKSEADLQRVQNDLDFAREDLDRYKFLVNNGAVAQRDLKQKELAVQQAQSAVANAYKAIEIDHAKIKNAEAAMNPNNAIVKIAQQKVLQEEADGEIKIAESKQEREDLSQRQYEIESEIKKQEKDLKQVELQLKRTEVKSTQTGTLFKLNLVNSGQVVQSGEVIAQIFPSDAPLIIKTSVALQDIEKVSKGQKVQLKVAACPHPDYGLLEGTVETVSSDALSNTGNTPASSNSPTNTGNTSYFEVTIKPKVNELNEFGHGKKQCKIQAGMNAKADIITREDTVLLFLLRKARLIMDL